MRVFISYSHKDKGFVSILYRALRQHSIDVRLDEHHVEIGEYLSQKIASEIYDADFVIIVLSPDSIASQWVHYELALVLQREGKDSRIRLLPLLIRTVALPTILSDRLIADFRTPASMDKDFQRLLRVLRVEKKQPIKVFVITAPISGTFYRGSDGRPFVEVGQHISYGDPLCLIEFYFTLNKIESEVQGSIIDILGHDGKSVEYDEPLFLIDTEGGKDGEMINSLRKSLRGTGYANQQSTDAPQTFGLVESCPSCGSDSLGVTDGFIQFCNDCMWRY